MSRLFSLLLLFLSISFAVPKHVKETLKELSPGIYGVFGVYTSGEKLPPYLRLPEKAIAYSVAIKVSK